MQVRHPVNDEQGRKARRRRLREGLQKLLRLGLCPVPLRLPGEEYTDRVSRRRVATGKEPLHSGFAVAAANVSEADIKRWLEELEDFNVGILLGLRGPAPFDYSPRDGVVDVEEDDPEAAKAVEKRLGGWPRTLSYRSSGGGLHRLYRLTPALARRLLEMGIKTAVIKDDPAYPGLEIRLGTLEPDAGVKGCCSVVPPSATVRKDTAEVGAEREWIDEPIADFPEVLIADLARNSLAVARARALEDARRYRAAAGPPRAAPGNPDGLTPLEKIQSALDELGIAYQEEGDGFASRCPAHQGSKKNFNFREDPETGNALIICHFGCHPEQIVEDLGLTMRDLFPDRYRRVLPKRGRYASNIDLIVDRRAAISDEECEAWAAEQEDYAEALRGLPRMVSALAERLRLPARALDEIEFGLRLRNPAKVDGDWDDLGPAWTWAERDHRGRVVGINRRFVNARHGKRLIGSRRDDPEHPHAVTHRAARGLVFGGDFTGPGGPVVIVEGESDFLALRRAGFDAVGRPGARAGLDEVARLLRSLPPDRPIWLLGERDEDGKDWPGDPAPPARKLARLLRRPVAPMLPPVEFKGTREWVASLIGTPAARNPKRGV